MAIIKPSRAFKGSELNLANSNAPYIKDGVKRAVFSKKVNQEGAYVYFLPAYKVDADGNGVWYKSLTIRDNFGDNFKEKYVVEDRDSDPADYFARNFKLLYPDEAAVVTVEQNGKQFKKYPNYGRNAQRVLYNVAFAQNLKAGAHVLDLPLMNGADALHNWMLEKDLHGNERPIVNDPDDCLAVHIRMKDNSANPWSIVPDPSQRISLPPQLSDSDYLYDLDHVLSFKSKDDILSGLRKLYSRAVFEACMDGYEGLTASNTVSTHVPPAKAAVKAAPAKATPGERIEVEVSDEDTDYAPPIRQSAPAPARKAPTPHPLDPEPEEVYEAPAPRPTPRKAAPPADDADFAKPTYGGDEVAERSARKLPPNPMAGVSREQAKKFLEEQD